MNLNFHLILKLILTHLFIILSLFLLYYGYVELNKLIIDNTNWAIKKNTNIIEKDKTLQEKKETYFQLKEEPKDQKINKDKIEEEKKTKEGFEEEKKNE